MISKMIIFLFIATTRAYFLDYSHYDTNDTPSIDECVNHQHLCNPDFERPCCNKNDTCNFLGQRLGDNIYACTYKKSLGENCEHQFECSSILHAICSRNEKCECIPSYIEVNKFQCAPLITSLCWKDEDCAVNNSICIKNRCICKPSFVSHFKDHCKPTQLGEYCSEDYDCKDMIHILCSEEKKCACRLNRIVKNNATGALILGGFCENDDACAPDNSICSHNKCQCKNGYMSLLEDSCVPTSIGKYCDSDHDCNDLMHMKCLENKCTCRPHHVVMNNATCASLLGGFCQNDKECGTKNSVCIDHKCECKNKYILENIYKCIRTPLGRTCNNDFDCGDIFSTRCSADNKCVCPENHITIDNTTCNPFLGIHCSEHEPCITENAVCVESKCQCKDTFKINFVNGICEPTTPLGKYCTESYDCEDILHIECCENKCVCKENTVLVNSKCKSLLHGYCWTDEECLSFNSVCKRNKCICKENYTNLLDGRCIPTQLGQTCEFDSDCKLLNAKCSKHNTCEII